MSPPEHGELRPVDAVVRGERLVPVQRGRDTERRPEDRERRRRRPRPPAAPQQPGDGHVDVRA
jgi:hypothetical protein